MPTHSYISHGMATLNYRTPSAATAPANVSQAHHHNLHNLHNNHHSSGMPKNMFGMYGPVSNLGPNAGGFLQQQQQQQFQHHQVQPSLHRMQQSAMYAPPPPPVQQITSPVTMPAMVEEDDDDFLSEITVQFDDGVQTLYVGPVEIIDTNGGVDEQQQQPTNPVPPPAAATPTVRSRERFQEERAIVTLEPVGGKTKSQPLPMYLQQQQQYQEQQRLKLQQKQQQQQQQQQQQKLQQQQKQQQKLQQKQQQQQQLLLLQQQQQERYQQQLREQISQHQLQKQLQQQLTQQQQPQQKASQVQQKPRLKQSKLKPQKQQELLQQRQHQQPQQQSHHQQNEAQRIQQMRLKQQALLQQMNLMKEFSPEQLLLLQQQSTFKSLNDSQLRHNQQQQQPSRSASASSSNSSSTSDWYQTQQQILYQQQFAMRFHQQMLNNQQLNVVQNQQPPEMQPQPPPATTARSKLCVRQAPMLNFALHNVPVSSSSSSSSNTNSQSKTAADAAVKRPLSSVVDGRRTAGKHMDPPPPVSQPAAKRPAHVIETAGGPIGDIAPATVLRSPPTPTQMVTIRVASEAQPQQQHQPPVLLTQLKQEPMTEEQCENNVIPDVVSSSPPPPPTPTTPLVEMKPSLATVAVKAVEPSSSANATVVMASCTERTVAALASVMMVSNKRVDDNVPAAAVDDVPVLSVAEVPHVPNGCGSSIETALEKRNSKNDEIPCPITMNGTQQCRNEEEKMQEMASPSLPVNVAVNDVPEQTKVPVKRGRGRPPKTSHQKPAPTAKVVTELSAPEETTTNSCTTTVVEQHVGVVSDLGDSINVRVESQVGEVKRSSKKKGYISVGALFASAKTARKQQNVAKKQKVESVSVATKEESSTIAIAAEPVPERTATAEETVTAANTTAVTNAPNEQQVLAENKTEQAISTPAAACAAVNCEDDTEINGPSNLQEEITVQPTLPTGGKTTREESVASGDGGESSVSSLTEEGVVGSGAKQSADLISGAVPDTEKESSPASDSGIESVTETGTNNASKKSKERSRSCLLSLPSSSNLEDKSQPINDEPAVVVKQESEQQKLRVVSRRQTIATESVKRDSNDDEEKIVRKGKRTMRANRKLSAKAKEAAEATEAAEAAEAVVVEATDASESANNVSLSSRDELKCPKCKMQFKTDLWYRKHLLNHHDIQPEQSAQLLSEDGSSARIEDETMPSPASTTEETEPPVAVNGSANTDENCVENYLPTAETVIEAVTGDVSQNDTEPEQALIPDEAISPKIILPAAESKVSSGRKRKSTPYGGANASKEETTSSLDATMASNGSIATEELLLPVVTNVKVEYRTLSGAQSRDRAEEEADEAEGSDEFGSSPLPSVKNRSKSSRRKSSIVTPPVVETITKVEKQDPDDADKLTPFEAAKVTVIESELTGETHYTCTICGGQFTGKSSIKEHLSTSHAAIKRRSCEYCGRTFIQTGDLTRHTRIHTGYRPFKCPVVECSFAFISSGDLHKHVRRHNQQPLPKPHVCDQCGKDFERSYDLKRHKTMHAKSEPDFKGISCGVCGKVFARQDQFRAHTYRHIGYRPYQCEICGKAFTDPSNYSKHARLHEMDGVEVVCNFCGRPFKNKSAISKHIFHCQQKTSGAARKASGSKKRGGDTKKDGKKSRRVGMAVGYGKESGDDTTMVVNPKQENVTYDEQRPIVTKRELADSELEGGGSPSAGGRTKQQKQQQQASRKRKKRRQRTPSSTEEDDNDDDDGDDGDEDSGDDFIGPSSSCDPYGTATFAGGAVKRDRRSRKLSLSQYDADK